MNELMRIVYRHVDIQTRRYIAAIAGFTRKLGRGIYIYIYIYIYIE